MSANRLMASAAAVLALTGCNLAPPYRTPLAPVPVAYKEAGPWQPARPADDLSRGAWWELFGDETLNGLEPQIDAANPDLAATVARYDQARAFAAEAGASLYPQVAAGGQLTTDRQSKDRPLRINPDHTYYGANDVAISASYELDLWGKLRNQAAAGRATAQASAADLATVRLSLQAELATDYWALRGADAQVQLLTDTVAAYQKAFDLTERRFQGKIVSSLDVSRAKTQLRAAQASLATASASRALLEHAIATLVGKPASDFSIPPKVIAFTTPDIPPGLPSDLLQRRPDIASAERAAKAANAGVGVARAAFYPSLSLNLLGGFQSTHLSLFNLSDTFWTLGPGLTLPLFEGGRLKAQESAAYARLREAGDTYRSIVLKAFQDVEDQAALSRQLAQASADEEDGVKAAQHTLEVALTLYRMGAASYLDVVVAQTALLQSQQTALDLRTRRQLAAVGMIRALGGGWDAKDLPSDGEATRLAANR
ncbi:MAG TPA: efflux transporter outer membrane subunit [Phenylobacterium sp.]|jgi:NodT family efflux transporter outer membrane factor (OMF) lipoprotein|uniref:efflux transporter outer membrane subunit n=1 Tax=Phenylobacterium sp. TaxID=1871053 RepID=UPI002BCE8DAA|nr:efflux transporter outer membrane subunit [Phenylobacterium sp.]HXA37379.1 efflux transporter outer membrane subunit [Phenylobacterium sp.]